MEETNKAVVRIDPAEDSRAYSLTHIRDEVRELKEGLREHVRGLLARITPEDSPYETAEINELTAAIAMFNATDYRIVPTRINSRFPTKPYADIHDIMEGVKGPLGRQGLAITQTIKSSGLDVTLHTRIAHTSGQWMESRMPLVLGRHEDVQKVGGEITYKRRYAIVSLLALSIHEDPEDDDGEYVVKDRVHEEKRATSIRQQYPGKEKSMGLLDHQIVELNSILSPWKEVRDRLYKSLDITRLEQVPRDQYDRIKDTALRSIAAIKNPGPQ